MAERLDASQLADFLYNLVPATGEITYTELLTKVKQSAHPEAINFLSQLKAAKRIAPKLEATPNGVVHTYRRIG